MEQIPPIPETPLSAPKEPTMSLAARLLNVFAVPGDVFEDVKGAKASVTNWLVPVAISSVVGVIAAVVMFSQPAIRQQLHEQQVKTMDHQVQKGQMTRAQADRTMEMIEKFTGPAMLMIFGSVGAVFASFVRVFWWALVLWLLGRWFLKARFNYLKTVELAGLASMITVLGLIVTVLLTVNLGKLFSTPSLALTVADFDPKNRGHLLLGAMNVVNLWQVGVLSAGLAKFSGAPFVRAALVVFGYWIAAELLLISVGLGQMAM